MKRSALPVISLIAMIVLTACGSGTSSRTGSGGGVGAITLTPETKLALGTIKLEGTPQAIDPASAAKLLPLWELLRQLSSSTSAAPQEISAVLDQIRATMTPSQVNSINSMQFSQADILSAFQQARSSSSGGTGGTGGSGGGSGSRNQGSNRGGGGGQFFFGGGGPGGGFPGGGFGNAGGTGTPTAAQQTGAAASAQSTANRSSVFLVGEVIRLLQSKVGS